MSRINRIGFAALLAAMLFSGRTLAQITVAPILIPVQPPAAIESFWGLFYCPDAGCVVTNTGCLCVHGLLLEETVSITNPGAVGGSSPGGDLCADIYVFKSDQQMSECCGCKVTPDGLLTLGLRSNLLRSPLTGIAGTSGTIKIVSSATSAGGCNAAQPIPVPWLNAWATHLRVNTSGTAEFTETAFKGGPLSASELSKLGTQCGFIQAAGSGQGICTCGTGD